MFEKAIELDPKYAAAYAFLGMIHMQEWTFLWSQDPQSLEQGFELAQKAIAMDDSLSLAHIVLGAGYLLRKQHEQAIAEAERAISLDPNFAEGYGGAGVRFELGGQARGSHWGGGEGDAPQPP